MTIMAEPPNPHSYNWRGMARYAAGPPDVALVVPDGLLCPLDDVLLVPEAEFGTQACPACLGCWDNEGRNGMWLSLQLAGDLESVGGLTLDEAVEFDDLVESTGLLSSEGRVTCRRCWAWATPEHLAGQQHANTAMEWLDE